MSALAAIAARAAEGGLPFLLAGGHAVLWHGYERLTIDLDLVVRRSQREDWIKLLTALGHPQVFEGPVFIQFGPEPDTQTPVDLMLSNDETFTKFQKDEMRTREGNESIAVVSIEHLLALKCHAIKHGHAGRIVKDVNDVIHLFLANRLDIEEARWRELVLKYGTAELYEKLRRACKI